MISLTFSLSLTPLSLALPLCFLYFSLMCTLFSTHTYFVVPDPSLRPSHRFLCQCFLYNTIMPLLLTSHPFLHPLTPFFLCPHAYFLVPDFSFTCHLFPAHSLAFSCTLIFHMGTFLHHCSCMLALFWHTFFLKHLPFLMLLPFRHFCSSLCLHACSFSHEHSLFCEHSLLHVLTLSLVFPFSFSLSWALSHVLTLPFMQVYFLMPSLFLTFSLSCALTHFLTILCFSHSHACFLMTSLCIPHHHTCAISPFAVSLLISCAFPFWSAPSFSWTCFFCALPLPYTLILSCTCFLFLMKPRSHMFMCFTPYLCLPFLCPPFPCPSTFSCGLSFSFNLSYAPFPLFFSSLSHVLFLSLLIPPS